MILPVTLVWAALLAGAVSGAIPNARPPPEQRLFTSSAVEAFLAFLVPQFLDPDLGTMLANSLPNTLDTTVQLASANDTFVITGDIEAMWLRDSTNQLMPYFQVPNPDSALIDLMRGAVLRQMRSVLLDGYANAFNIGPNGNGHQGDTRYPPMTLGVFEGKFELDSLAAALKLSAAYHDLTADASVFESADSPYLDAVARILDIVTEMQASTAEDGQQPAYNFTRVSEMELYPNPLTPAARCGLSKCGFRPSDDQTYFGPFLIPANAMAATELARTAALLGGLADPRAPPLAAQASSLAMELRAAVLAEAVTPSGIFAYEVDGFGRQKVMDDANVPSLLSLPYLGFVDASDPVYAATRARLLSPENPYFYSGTEGSGIGSPHTPVDYIWPMAVSLQALTSADDAEITACLRTLKNSAFATGLMHESFNKDDATQYTRPWFAWANSLFAELIIKLANERPYLILQPTGQVLQ